MEAVWMLQIVVLSIVVLRVAASIIVRRNAAISSFEKNERESRLLAGYRVARRHPSLP